LRKKAIGIIGFLVAIALILAIIAPHVRPNQRDILVLFGLIFPYTFLLAGSIRNFTSYVKPSLSKNKVVAGDLTVLSYNAMMGVKLVNEKHVFNKERQARFDELMHRDVAPHVICAQEVNDIVDQALKASFNYPHYHKLKKRGAIIMSKFPMIKKGSVDFGAQLNSCLWADIVVPVGEQQDTVRIYSAHFESNRLSQSSYEFLAKEDYEGAEAIAGIKDLITKYPRYASKRGEQALKVKAHIDKSPYPVILAGDFNDPPMSYTYHVFEEDLCDSFIEEGYGWGTTWIGAIPMLRIDYILSSPEMKIVDFQCLQSDMSDHFPVKATYSLKERFL